MFVHDWSRVPAGVFHDFHHGWISDIKRALNDGVLSDDYYAIAERWAPRRVLTASRSHSGVFPGDASPRTEEDWYRRKKSHVAVRHVSDDRVVALIEIVSAGNKSSKRAFQDFVDKALELLNADVHLLLIDVLPRTRRDADGIHPAIWENITDDPVNGGSHGPLSTVAYEVVRSGVNAYCESFAVGQPLPDMPLFLAEDAQVPVPLEKTYGSAYAAVPLRWRRVIEGVE